MRERLPLAISLAALVVAVFGSTPLGEAALEAVAPASIGTAQLKNNAVTAPKLKANAVNSAKVLNGSLVAADFRANSLPRGQTGPPGAAGAAGPAGPAGPPGVAGLEIVTLDETVAAGTFGGATVSCPAGKRALGGGGRSSLAGVAMLTSRPSGTGWEARWYAPTSGHTVTTYAVCATVG
jgi:hypothetical protein